jgi:cytochrome oxidase Cu insertion factor (SCO1/SenC/PrrC family)
MSSSHAASAADVTTDKPIDRAALFAEGPPRIPRKTIWIALAVAAVLGIGGAFADHSFNVAPTASPTPVARHATVEQQTLASFVGLKTLKTTPAPAIDLIDGDAKQFSLKELAGRPVILTFLGATCGEDCSVVAPELADAVAALTKAHLRPAVVIVNADPEHLSVQSARAALARGPIATISGATFLTGPLTTIQRIWKSYGVTIEVDPSTGALAYTNVVYLIDTRGALRVSLTPFANESFSGTASLPAAEIERFASGVVTYVRRIAR